MNIASLRASRAEALKSLLMELYTLPATPDMAGQRADIVGEIDSLRADFRRRLLAGHG
ncbi:MAG: hypothetical protein SH809_12020 [Rhodothermales bacterium]|nr:hypothetical protein [Rhodothermales bacterium]